MPRKKKELDNFETVGATEETRATVPASSPADSIKGVQERRDAELPTKEDEENEPTKRRKKYKKRTDSKPSDVSAEVIESADYISEVVTGGINVLSVNVLKEAPLSAEEEKLSTFAVKGYIRKMSPEQFEAAPGYVLLGVALLIFGPRLYFMYERLKAEKSKKTEGVPVGST